MNNHGKHCIKRMPFLIVHLYALSVKHFSVIQLWNFSDKTNNIVYFLASFLLIAYFPGKLIILRVRSFWNSEGFREILRYDKKKKNNNRNAICGLRTSTKCWEPIHIIKNHSKTLSKRDFWHKFLMSCVDGFLFTC